MERVLWDKVREQAEVWEEAVAEAECLPDRQAGVEIVQEQDLAEVVFAQVVVQRFLIKLGHHAVL